MRIIADVPFAVAVTMLKEFELSSGLNKDFLKVLELIKRDGDIQFVVFSGDIKHPAEQTQTGALFEDRYMVQIHVPLQSTVATLAIRAAYKVETLTKEKCLQLVSDHLVSFHLMKPFIRESREGDHNNYGATHIVEIDLLQTPFVPFHDLRHNTMEFRTFNSVMKKEAGLTIEYSAKTGYNNVRVADVRIYAEDTRFSAKAKQLAKKLMTFTPHLDIAYFGPNDDKIYWQG